MKKFYTLLLISCAAFISHAQIVTFADSNFKTYLVQQPCIDTDNDDLPDAVVDTNQDGEIQNSEAEAVTSLTIYSFYQIVDLEGIQAFTNLKILRSFVPALAATMNSLHNLETLDLSFSHSNFDFTMSNMLLLKTLNLSYTNITAVNLTNMPNLESLGFGNSQVATLSLTGLPILSSLNCSYSSLTNIDFNGLGALTDFNCSGSANLTSLNLTNIPNLEYLTCDSFRGTTMNLTNLPHLKQLQCSFSSLTTIDLSQLTALESFSFLGSGSLTNITLGNLPALKAIAAGGCSLNAMDISGTPNLVEILCGDNHLTTLDVSNKPHLERIWCDNNQIAVLDVAADTSLIDLNCKKNLISTLDITNLTNLQWLNCSENAISQLNTTNLVNLTSLIFNNNNVTSVNTTSLANLSRFNSSNNPINTNTFDTSNLLNLTLFYCSNNHLTSLNIGHLTKLKTLDCSNNQLTALSFPTTNYHNTSTHSHNPTVSRFVCNNNLFTTLDFSSISSDAVYVYLADNPNLTYVNIKNMTSYYEVRSIANSPNLTYICVNEYAPSVNTINVIFSYVDLSLLTNIQINPYCSFTPGGLYNTISGTFSMDLDNNGCDANDFLMSGSKILINSSASPLFNATYTMPTGNYTFHTQAGNYVITPVFENPYYLVSPASATVSFADDNSNAHTENFCIIPNGVHNDVEITLLPHRARPGFNSYYDLVYKNKGNQTLSGNINLTFNDAVLDYVSSAPAFTNQSLNTLHWTYTDLKPFESRSIVVVLNLNSPQETPTVNVGDILNFTVAIDPIFGDETVADNTFNIMQTVRGAIDPNDKTCLEGNTLTPEMVGGYLHYMIRFENTGNEPAENIVVKDMIDTTKFDITSLELTSSSHPQVTKILGNKVEFQFQNINLPAQSVDEAGSHGFVAFKIKTKNDLVLGNTISNTADIYFDYNFPIATNTTNTTISLLGVNQLENTSVNVAPNPVKNLLHIQAKGTITSVELLDVQGRILQTRLFDNDQVDFDLSHQAAGIYFVKIRTDKGQSIEKIIKE